MSAAHEPGGPDRREFLHAGLAGLAVAAEPPELFDNGPDKVPKKAFGKTGEKVSIIGIGGYTPAEARTKEEAVKIVHEAVDAGVTFFDNAWEYHKGKSEEWMGE